MAATWQRKRCVLYRRREMNAMRPSCLLVATICAFVAAARADVAVSMRYYKTAGNEHHRLFLYSDDGKLIRPLTDADAGDDTDPVFSPDGAHVVFSRKTGEGSAFYRVDRNGSYAKTLDAAPEWWKSAAFLLAFADKQGGGVLAGESSEREPGVHRFTAADRAAQIVIRPQKQNREALDLAVRIPAEGVEKAGVDLPGYAGMFDVVTFRRSPFLSIPPLQVAFVNGSHHATLGTSLLALDLSGPRFVMLAENGGRIFPLPDRPGFFCLRTDRGKPRGEDLRTLNGTSLEWWNAALAPTRYAAELGTFGGAAIEWNGKRFAIRQAGR